MPPNHAVDPGANALDHSVYYRSLTPPIVDFTDIPLCFAPPYKIPFYSKSADTFPCMDHPDLSAGLRLPRKTKSSRSSKSDRDVRLHSLSSNQVESGEKRSKSPIPFDQRVSHTQNFTIYSAVAPLDPGFLARKQALESSLPSQPQKDAAPRRRFTLLTRRTRPAPIKTSRNEDPASQQHARRQPVTPADSRLMHAKYSPANTSITAPAASAQDAASAKSSSPPSTPGFMRRLLERIETAPRPRTPSPTFSFEDPPDPAEADLAEAQDLALFAAATAGLTPEQPFAAGQMRQYAPLSQEGQRFATRKSSKSHVPLPLSPNKNQSLPSLLQGNGFPSMAASSSDYESAASLRRSRSRPCPPRVSCDTGPWNTYGLSQSSPLSGWDTSLSSRVNASREQGLNRLSTSRSFDVSRQPQPAMQEEFPPMPYGSGLMRSPLPTALLPPNHLQIPTQSSNKAFTPRPSIGAPVKSPISPPDTVIQWHDDDVSAMSVDTQTYRRNPRISAISTLSSISTLDGGVSPIVPDDDCELPDYRTSQEEMARMQQSENVKRAQELQMRWLLSRGY